MGRRRSNRSTIYKDPFEAVIPSPTSTGHPTNNVSSQTGVEVRRRQKLTIHLDADLADRVKNAAYWNPRLTIAKIAEMGIRIALEEVETENEGPYKPRASELVGGRPIK